MTDIELADLIRLHASQLNVFTQEAAKRELIVRYDIKQAVGNPKLNVSIMTEVA